MRQWQILLGLGKDEEISSMISSPDDSPYIQAIMDGRIAEKELWNRMGRKWRLSPFMVNWLRRNAMSQRRLNQRGGKISGRFAPAV